MENLISVIFLFKNKASSLILGLDWIRMNHKLLGWLPLGLNNLQQVHIGWLSASASEERKSLSAKERIARATWQVTEDPSSGVHVCSTFTHLHIYPQSIQFPPSKYLFDMIRPSRTKFTIDTACGFSMFFHFYHLCC
jgi:hypothetical protein